MTFREIMDLFKDDPTTAMVAGLDMLKSIYLARPCTNDECHSAVNNWIEHYGVPDEMSINNNF